MRRAMKASFAVECVCDLFVLIRDKDDGTGPSVTNDAHGVVSQVHAGIVSLKRRRLFYRDSAGQIDELKHDGQGRFMGFAPCKYSERQYLSSLIDR